MRNIQPAMAALLASEVRTIATCWRVQRQDGAVFGFTDHDQSLLFNNETYSTYEAYTASAIDMSATLATQNMEVTALFTTNGAVTKPDIIAGLWDYADVTIFLVNFMDLSPTYGSVVMSAGKLGQFVLNNGKYTAELRGLAQIMQQDQGQQFSPTCRATLGDARCTIDLTPFTYNGTVATANGAIGFTDAGLVQVGPSSAFVDQTGRFIPTTFPYTITAVPPTGGAWQSDNGVIGPDGTTWTPTVGFLTDKEYNVTAGVYTFSSSNAGQLVRMNYQYSIGYFAYGLLTWTSGANAGYSMEVKKSSVGAIELALPMPYPIQPGDTYRVTAGCDRLPGTCKTRFNNLIHFRGEQFIPGADRIFRTQGG